MNKRNVIIFNDTYSMEKDEHCWHLHEKYMGKDKEGGDKEKKRTTYHSNIKQVCAAILNDAAGHCAAAVEMNDLFCNAVEILTTEVTGKIEQNHE